MSEGGNVTESMWDRIEQAFLRQLEQLAATQTWWNTALRLYAGAST